MPPESVSPGFHLSRAQVRELDRRAAADYGLPGIVLMENAGRGCAELLMRLNPDKRPVVILCGPGNNGGDGFVMARHLDNAKWPVWVWVRARADQFGADALTNLTVAQRSRHGLVQAGPGTGDLPGMEARLLAVHGGRGTWFVDALFGTGLARPVASPYSELVDAINSSDDPVLAIDVPSGLDCDTGEPLGPTVRATHTATFVAPKLGFGTPASRAWTGDVHVIDIGAPRKLVDEFRNRVGGRPA